MSRWIVIVEGLMANEEVAGRLSEICGSHSDYMWEIQLETP